MLRSMTLAALLAALPTISIAQTMVYPTGPYGAMIINPGSPTVGAYAIPGYGGSTTYIAPPQQSQNWRQYSPAWQYGVRRD